MVESRRERGEKRERRRTGNERRNEKRVRRNGERETRIEGQRQRKREYSRSCIRKVYSQKVVENSEDWDGYRSDGIGR